MRDGGDFVSVARNDFRIGHSPEKAGEAGHALGSAIREKRGTPDGAQQVQPLAAGNQKAEAVEAVLGFALLDLIHAIAGGDLRHAGIFDFAEQFAEARPAGPDAAQQAPSLGGRRGQDQSSEAA